MQKCKTCGKAFEYCSKCALTKIDYMESGFCSQEHRDIFVTLYKNTCNQLTDEETVVAMSKYNTSDVHPYIIERLDEIKSNIAVKTDAIEKQNIDMLPAEAPEEAE